MKLPTGSPVMQHHFNVTFNGQHVEGLTDWIDDVCIDYVEQKIGLSFLLSYDKDPDNTLSHQKLVALMSVPETTMEVHILTPSNEEVCKEVFHNLKIAELYYGLNACLSSGDNSSILSDEDEKELDTRPRRVSMFDNPVNVSASIKFGVTSNGNGKLS